MSEAEEEAAEPRSTDAGRRCGPSAKGRIVRWELFVDKAEALKAAGLSE